mgnify:CR=1 FL=1
MEENCAEMDRLKSERQGELTKLQMAKRKAELSVTSLQQQLAQKVLLVYSGRWVHTVFGGWLNDVALFTHLRTPPLSLLYVSLIPNHQRSSISQDDHVNLIVSNRYATEIMLR